MENNSKAKSWAIGAAVVGVITSIITNAASNYFAERDKLDAERRDRRVEAYTEFASGQALRQTGYLRLYSLIAEMETAVGATTDRRPGDSDDPLAYAKELVSLIDDAESRTRYGERLQGVTKSLEEASEKFTRSAFKIGVYGDSAVITSIAHYFRAFVHQGAPCQGSRAKWIADAANYQSIRNDAVGGSARQRASNEDIITLVFGCEIPSADG